MDITENGKKVGFLTAQKQGLYTVFSAVCTFDGGGMRRILLVGKGRTEDLGICVPDGNRWVVSTRRKTASLPELPWQVSTDAGEEADFCEFPYARLEKGRIVVTPANLR